MILKVRIIKHKNTKYAIMYKHTQTKQTPTHTDIQTQTQMTLTNVSMPISHCTSFKTLPFEEKRKGCNETKIN